MAVQCYRILITYGHASPICLTCFFNKRTNYTYITLKMWATTEDTKTSMTKSTALPNEDVVMLLHAVESSTDSGIQWAASCKFIWMTHELLHVDPETRHEGMTLTSVILLKLNSTWSDRFWWRQNSLVWLNKPVLTLICHWMDIPKPTFSSIKTS